MNAQGTVQVVSYTHPPHFRLPVFPAPHSPLSCWCPLFALSLKIVREVLAPQSRQDLAVFKQVLLEELCQEIKGFGLSVTFLSLSALLEPGIMLSSAQTNDSVLAVKKLNPEGETQVNTMVTRWYGLLFFLH